MSDKNNIILLTIDCLRYDRCGFNGHQRKTTPFLDRLATDSYVFDHAYATGSYTTESFPGILAGQHSYNGSYYGKDSAWKAISPDSETLASHLKNHGYETCAIITNPHLSESRGFAQGFDEYTNIGLSTNNQTRPKNRNNSNNRTWISSFLDAGKKSFQQLTHSSKLALPPLIAYRYYQYYYNWPSTQGEQVIETALRNMEELSAPFFLWIHLMDLHAPIHPEATQEHGIIPSKLSHFFADANRIRETYCCKYSDMYDDALQYVDSLVKRLVNWLRNLNQWQNTSFVLTGDHGEVLFDRDEIYGHPRHHAYDELLHVPLLVHTPTFENGKRISRNVSLAWINEIISELASIPVAELPASSETSSLLTGKKPILKPVISDSLDNYGHTVAVRDDTSKVISHRRSVNANEQIYDYEFINHDVAFQYRLDCSERYPQPVRSNSELAEKAHSLQVDPQDIPKISGHFNNHIKQRLKDLGYKT